MRPPTQRIFHVTDFLVRVLIIASIVGPTAVPISVSAEVEKSVSIMSAPRQSAPNPGTPDNLDVVVDEALVADEPTILFAPVYIDLTIMAT